MTTPQQPEIEIGPQYRPDDPFTARLRFHQSWYRARRLGVPPGVGPKASSKTILGSMLTRPDGEQHGLNFLTRHIFEVARRRLALKKGAVDPFRLACSLLSPQALCFNLFAPLVDDQELALQLLNAVLPGEVKSVAKVMLEYTPEPVNRFLNELSVFNAFLEYRRADHRASFVGVETRLADPLPGKVFSSPIYERWHAHPGSPWLPGSLPELKTAPLNALWRSHLLATAMNLAPNSRYTAGRLLLLYHPQDAQTAGAVQRYQALLKPDDATFSALPLDRLVERWRAALNSPTAQDWLAAFTLRYLDLEASEAEYHFRHGE
ncbi:MAG: PGN_0703 family putative restriction endonuclease [Chloroflexota bacterium]